jgi:hypothetical protein
MSGGVSLKLSLLIPFVFIFAVGGLAQESKPVGVEDIYLARDNGKGQAGDAATVFRTTDIPIFCVVKLDNSDSRVTVKMNLVAENVPGVKADTSVVSTTYTTKSGENRVNFDGRPYGKWTAGKYRADIFIDGKLSRNLSFEIKEAPNTSSGIKAFQPPKRTSRAMGKPTKNPYVQSTAGVINP